MKRPKPALALAPTPPAATPDAPAKTGRPPFQPEARQRSMVRTLGGHGMPHYVIAELIGCDVKTLRKYFRDDLDGGRDFVKASMVAAIVRAGTNGNVVAAKYWLTLFGGPEWRVTEHREITGKLEIHDQSTDDLERELDALRAKQEKADRGRAVAEAVPDGIPGILH